MTGLILAPHNDPEKHMPMRRAPEAWQSDSYKDREQLYP